MAMALLVIEHQEKHTPKDCAAISEGCLWEAPVVSGGGVLGAEIATALAAAALASFAAASAFAAGCARAADAATMPSLPNTALICGSPAVQLMFI